MADPTLIAGILAAAISLPGVRDEGHLRAYASGTASAVEYATCSGDWAQADWCQPVWRRSNQELAALLVILGWFESRLLARIAAGRCRSYECDAVKLHDGRIFHKARGTYQIQYTGHVTRQEWREMIGLGEWSFFVASYTAAKILGSHERSCKTIPGAISGFATGGRCFWSGTRTRMTAYNKLLPRLLPAADEGPQREPPKAVASTGR